MHDPSIAFFYGNREIRKTGNQETANALQTKKDASCEASFQFILPSMVA
jgi:hypothetical protein